MPLLGGLLLSLFSGLSEFLVKYLGKKAGFGLAAVSTFALLTGTFLGAMAMAINGLIPAMPGGQYISLGMWLAIPDNAPAVVSACLAADATAAVYRWNKYNLQLFTQA